NHGRVSEHVARGRWQARRGPRLLVGVPGFFGALGPAQHQRVDDAAPAALGRRTRIAGRRPQRGHRLLIGARPDVDVTMSKMLALPTERAVTMDERLADEIDALPQPLFVLHGIGVVRGHLAAAGLYQPDLEAAARYDVDHRVFLGDPDRVLAQGNQRAEAQNARLASLPRNHADEGRVGADQAVDAGVMLGGHDVKPNVVGDQIFVQRFVEQIGGDLGVAIFVGQARAHRSGGVEHVLRDERVGHFAAVKGPHGRLYSDWDARPQGPLIVATTRATESA